MTLKGIVIYLLNQAFILLKRLEVGGGEVPRRQPHCRSGLVTQPSIGAVP